MKNYFSRCVFVCIALLCAAAPMFAGVLSPVPEPSSALMLGGGLGAVILLYRYTHRKKQ